MPIDRAVDAVLFDFGGVIMPSPFDAFRALEQRAGVPAGAVRAINSRNPDDNAWARIERGELDADEFVRLFEREAAEAGVALPGQAVLEVVAASSPARSAARPAMLDAVTRCRAAGVRPGLLTNNVRPLGQYPESAWLWDEFDAVLESSVVGTRKPEPAIYRLALEALGVAPERTALLDDLGINLKPARALGLHTIKVVDPDAALAQLFALLDPAGRRS